MAKLLAGRPHFRFEAAALERGAVPVCGVDEAGRGPWAGPVVAAAVVLDPDHIPDGLNDSKRLSPERREALFAVISAQAQVGIGLATVAEIDSRNILNATLAAMMAAVAALPAVPVLALIDGTSAPRLACATRAIVAGDAASLSIAAASIVAKVARDRLMTALDAQCPGYGFARHKGYGTPAHRQALNRLGPSIHHRLSFAPIKDLIAR